MVVLANEDLHSMHRGERTFSFSYPFSKWKEISNKLVSGLCETYWSREVSSQQKASSFTQESVARQEQRQSKRVAKKDQLENQISYFESLRRYVRLLWRRQSKVSFYRPHQQRWIQNSQTEWSFRSRQFLLLDKEKRLSDRFTSAVFQLQHG